MKISPKLQVFINIYIMDNIYNEAGSQVGIYGFHINPAFEQCFIYVYSVPRTWRISIPAISDVIWDPINLFLTLAAIVRLLIKFLKYVII